MSILNAKYRVTMPDGSDWEVPVRVIAECRAEYYGPLDKMTPEEALADTAELFEDDHYEVHDWASGNMNWDEVKHHAVKVADKAPDEINFQDGWVNGSYKVVPESD